MKIGAPGSFGAQLKALRETAGFTQEELATIAGLSVHAVSALERGERRRPHVETVRALAAALDLSGPALNAFLGSARAPGPAAAAGMRGTPLPMPLTSLVGRDAEMETLREWVADPGLRLITLVGPGGVGKSRLVLELARAVTLEPGAPPVVFLCLSAIHDPEFVAPAIAEALGLTDVASADLPERARGVCGDRLLLVLDNFEQVLEAGPLLAELLAAVPGLQLLVTSRAALRIRGEREFTVGPLALEADAERMSLADFARVPAVRLFVERVRDVRPDFRLTPALAPTVAAICRRLDALPLALELAAPWLKVLTPPDLLRRLGQDVLLEAPGPRDLPERQQTMNATVGWSYHLLDPSEQRAFRRFGVLPGLFPVDAAAEALSGFAPSPGLDDALSAIAALMDKSLLLRAETSAVATCPLYFMLETVRGYAQLELREAGESDEAIEGLVRYCAMESSLAREGLVGPAQTEWLDRAREDLDSYRTALSWLIDRGRAGEAADIASALLFFWLIRGHAAEGLQWFERILALPALPAPVEARALLGAAAMSHTRGDLAGARARLTRGLTLARDADDQTAVAEACWMSGHVEFAAGNLDAAGGWFARSRDAFQRHAIAWGIGSACSGLAWVALALGDAAEAERLVADAMLALQPAGPWFFALGLYIRVLLELRRGNADAVIRLMRESLTRVRESQDRFAVVYGLVPLALAAALKGDDAWVARILGAREAISERTGSLLVDPVLRDRCRQTEREVRTRLGADRWRQAFDAGRRASIDTMLKDIDVALG
jgi:predicted ATPase/DNA-binding XRE family transcriptional regulator